MGSNNNLELAILAGLAVAVLLHLFAGKGGVLEQAKAAGEQFGEWFKEWTTTSRAQGEVALGAQYVATPYVPPTPEGYNLSNWTWTLNTGTKLGLPAGMTPGEFCAVSPSSPVCEEIRGG